MRSPLLVDAPQDLGDDGISGGFGRELYPERDPPRIETTIDRLAPRAQRVDHRSQSALQNLQHRSRLSPIVRSAPSDDRRLALEDPIDLTTAQRCAPGDRRHGCAVYAETPLGRFDASMTLPCHRLETPKPNPADVEDARRDRGFTMQRRWCEVASTP